MATLLAVVLALPVLGAIAVIVLGARGREIGQLAAAVGAFAWAVLAAAGEPPQLGRIAPGPLVAAALAGLALLVAVRLPGSTFGASAALAGVTVLAVAASTGDGLPDRPLAVGLAILVLLAVGQLRLDAAPPVALIAVAAGGVLVGAGLLVDEPGTGAVVVLVGAGAVLFAAMRWRSAAILLVPAVTLAAARSAAGAHAGSTSGPGVAGLAGALVALAVAVALGGTVAFAARRRSTGAAVGAPVPLAVVVAGIALVAQDVPGLVSAGLLLVAGGVLAVAAAHPVGLVAAVPGLAVALEAAGAATEPVHALAGSAAVAVVAAAGARTPRQVRPVHATPDEWPLALAVVFAVVPLWGWSGADAAVLGELTDAVVTAGALASATTMTLVAIHVRASTPRPATAGAVTGKRRALGRIRRRSPAVSHGSTQPLVEEDRSNRGDVELPVEGQEAESAGRPSQHPVAAPSRAVPDRAGGRGDGGRGRLRARPGRPPR
jgi:hypothetical protein